MKKVYLVSHVQCWNDQAMDKQFQLFNTKEDAIKYKNELKVAIIADLMEYYEAQDEDDLFVDLTSDPFYCVGDEIDGFYLCVKDWDKLKGLALANNL